MYAKNMSMAGRLENAEIIIGNARQYPLIPEPLAELGFNRERLDAGGNHLTPSRLLSRAMVSRIQLAYMVPLWGDDRQATLNRTKVETIQVLRVAVKHILKSVTHKHTR